MADKGWSFILEVGQRASLTIPHTKELTQYEMVISIFFVLRMTIREKRNQNSENECSKTFYIQDGNHRNCFLVACVCCK